MATLSQEAQQWRLIARVRGLRVQRRQIALAHAQRVVQAARGEVQASEARLAQHAAQRAAVLARCTHGAFDAQIWRAALAQHRLEEARLRNALEAARAAHARALAEFAQTGMALRRETLAHDDARKRVREFAAKLRDDA